MTRRFSTLCVLAVAAATGPAAADTIPTKGLQRAMRSGAPVDLLRQPTFRPGGTPVRVELTGDVVDVGILRCARRKLGTMVVSEECMTRNMPLIEQTDYRIPPELIEAAKVGCFDTSILTVLRTQMAHAHPSLQPEGRTAMLVKATGNAAVPPEIAALTMLYRMQGMGQRQRDLLSGGFVTAAHASYYRLQEAAPDVNAGKVAEMKASPPCNPYADVWCNTAFNFNALVEMNWAGEEKPNALIDEASIEKRMRQGQSMVLGYVRFTPRVVGLGSNRRIRFDVGTPHKVVPAGFSTTGKYRMIINDVGYTGVHTPACQMGEGCLRKRGRLRRDIKAKLIEWGYPDAPIDLPEGVGAIVYEEDGDKLDDKTFRFVEFINVLSLRKKT